jgi:hypothetical protein
MDIGDFEDVRALAEAVGDDYLSHVIAQAEAGMFSRKSWIYGTIGLAWRRLETLLPRWSEGLGDSAFQTPHDDPFPCPTVALGRVGSRVSAWAGTLRRYCNCSPHRPRFSVDFDFITDKELDRRR